MKNKLIINASRFNVTDYSSWTLLFPEKETEMPVFLNLEGKVQACNQLLDLIKQAIAHLKRSKPTVLDYHFIFIFPALESPDFNIDFKELKTAGINAEFDCVFFAGTNIKQEDCNKFEIAVHHIADNNGVWNYAKYSFVLFDVVSLLIKDIELSNNQSDNYKTTISKSEATKTTGLTVSKIQLNNLFSNYKFFLQQQKETYSIKETDEQINVYDAGKTDSLNFATINNLCKETFKTFEIKHPKKKHLPDYIVPVYLDLTNHLRKIVSFLAAKERPFTLSNMPLNDTNKQSLTFKDDKRVNTQEIKDAVKDFQELLNKEETENLSLPKIRQTDVENVEIFSENILGNINNSNARKFSKKAAKQLFFLFLLIGLTIALPFMFHFNLKYLAYSSALCFVMYSLALLIAGFLQNKKIGKFNNKKQKEFNNYVDAITNKTKVDFSKVKTSLNRRKALAENINILENFLIRRQIEREEKVSMIHKIESLLNMADIKGAEAIQETETETESENLSIQAFFKKNVKDE